MTRHARSAAALATAALLCALPSPRQAARASDPAAPPASGSCGGCHAGIEDMHPWSRVTCVQCHGGDDGQTDKERAHVPARARPPGDERVLGPGYDAERMRFLDPGSLRAAAQACGPCHSKAVSDVTMSLHATTAGHLGDGLYENGVVRDRHPPVSVFSVSDGRPADAPRPPGAVPFLRQVGSFNAGSARDRVATHFADLPRKACMQCHLWSEGRAVRGRAGMDGDYRGEGCSACHVPYADDGLSLSRDPTVDRYEPGHPREHRMVRSPTTETCTRCHYGDASIGLSFRGLAQPVPGMPQSPDAPGLSRKRLNGIYYVEDPAATPPDVHHQRGMHCVDCHTRNDAMGDGWLYVRMEDAVEIRCETCHGTERAYADGLTAKGRTLPHLERRADGVYLRSRVTGASHRVKQARDVVRPGSPDFNPRAALAMTPDHGRLECHACHSGWNPNFFGFHFDRNEAFTQLDLLSGARTAGRATTQEKVFSTFKHFYLGWNSHGRVAPYMVGFSTMATVRDPEGGLLLDQALPVTQAGLSGMTMIHHQTHTTTARSRECAECHRAPSTYGRGSVNFRLAREFLVAGGDSGVRLVSLDRASPDASALLSALPVPEVRAVALLRDRLTGQGTHVFAASAAEGLVVCDVSKPGFPRIAARLADACGDPRALLVAGSRLFLADGEAGLAELDVSTPARPRLRTRTPELPAEALHLSGNTLFVAAGTRGLAALDVRDPAAPRLLGEPLDLNGKDTSPFEARAVETLFQYSRPSPDALEGPRLPARHLAAVAAGLAGLRLVDVTEPGAMRLLPQSSPVLAREVEAIDVALGTLQELGSEGGAIPTRERDLCVVLGRMGAQTVLVVVDVTEPERPVHRGAVILAGAGRSVRLLRVYEPPFLRTWAAVAGSNGVQLVDLARPAAPTLLATVADVTRAHDLDAEEFPLDLAVDADGRPVLDVSHAGARWLDDAELARVLGVPLPWGASPLAPSREERR